MAKRAPSVSAEATLQGCLADLKKAGTRKDFANLKRFGIDAPNAFGVSRSGPIAMVVGAVY